MDDESRFSSDFAVSLALMLLEMKAELEEFSFQMDQQSSSQEAVSV